MKHLEILFLILLLSIVNYPCKADVLLPIMMMPEPFIAALSLEKIFSIEKYDKNKSSFLPWAGIGYIWPFYYGETAPMIPAVGFEIALEGRIYPFTINNSGFFIGIYGGGSFMFPSYIVIASSLGIKSGYKHVVKVREESKFAVEPYISISTSPAACSTLWHSEQRKHFFGVIATFGIRFTHEFY
jgi:hypothetical protein